MKGVCRNDDTICCVVRRVCRARIGNLNAITLLSQCAFLHREKVSMKSIFFARHRVAGRSTSERPRNEIQDKTLASTRAERTDSACEKFFGNLAFKRASQTRFCSKSSESPAK